MYFSASRLGFFNDALGPDFVEVPAELHNSIMALIDQGYTLGADDAGNPIAIAPPAPPVPTLAEVYQQRLVALNGDYELAGQALRGMYPFTETTTWPVQLSEAKTYDAWRQAGSVGDPPLTPFLTDLATRRTAYGVGTGLADLVDRILANNALYSPAIAEITASRHAAEQALVLAYAAGAGTVEAVTAVTWNLTQNLAAPAS